MYEVQIIGIDPITGIRSVQQTALLPFADPPIKRKRLKRLARAVEAWATTSQAGGPLSEERVTADMALHRAYLDFIEPKAPKEVVQGTSIH